MPAYSHFDYYLRSVITAMLALSVIGVTAWQVISGSGVSGPFGSWAGLIIGVYFGSHVSLNGSGAKRRVMEEQSGLPTPVPVVPVAIVPPPTVTTQVETGA